MSAPASSIVVPSPAQGQGLQPHVVMAALIAVATAAQTDLNGLFAATQLGPTRQVRGVVTSNVASLSAFTGVSGGTPVDGITYQAGDRVLLVKQSTGTQVGIYVVGAVAAGAAPLTLAPDWSTGLVLPGMLVLVSEGTAWAGSEWKVTTTGAITVGTTSPALYPRTVRGKATLASGTVTVSNLWLLATTGNVQATRNTPGGTLGNLSAPAASRTAGAGSGALVLNSDSATESSTVDWMATNF